MSDEHAKSKRILFYQDMKTSMDPHSQFESYVQQKSETFLKEVQF